ncbi:MAG: hypothetical protein ABWZ80_02215 [Beijerinckiaceae bacterium]
MALAARHWQANARLVAASENKPSMKAGEGNRLATFILQNVLIATNFNIPAGATGNFMQQTSAAVRDAETQFSLTRDQGVAGKEVFGALDRFLTNPSQFVAGGASGSALATSDAPLALRKISKAIDALKRLETTLKNPATPTPTDAALVDDALRVHFRLTRTQGTIGVTRPFTLADITEILTMFNAIAGVLRDPANRFVDNLPQNGPLTAAEAPFGGQITFGPVFRNFDWRGLGRIGDNSRAAILIHEGMHIVDAVSGDDNTTHISEFDPRYNGQSPEFSKHNPSSYAGFAAHIDLGRDPTPRFGLGPGARGL